MYKQPAFLVLPLLLSDAQSESKTAALHQQCGDLARVH